MRVWLAALLVLVAPRTVLAFPEMVRNGYVNCMACHASPTGGGLLTEYGRGLSKEVLSHGRFFFEPKREPKEPLEGEGHEEDFLHGGVALPKGVTMGGDFRFLQLYQDTKTYRELRFIVMQADLEGMAEYKRVSLLASAGEKQAPPKSTRVTDSLISRRHFLMMKLGPEATPELVQLRAGRFLPAYGLNIPDHTAVTRRGLGFNQGQETYNAELSYIDENLNLYATGIAGRPDSLEAGAKRGGAVEASVPWGTTRKLGVNAYSGIAPNAPDSQRLGLIGAHAALGFSPRHYALVEADGTHSISDGWGNAEYLKLGWELTQGFHVYVSQQLARRFRTPDASTQVYDLGFLYYPRPHWEFTGAVEKQRDSALSGEFDFAAWLVLHYYL